MFGECYIVVIPSQCLSFVFVFLFTWSGPLFSLSPYSPAHTCSVFSLITWFTLLFCFLFKPHHFYCPPLVPCLLCHSVVSGLVSCCCKPAVWILCGQELKPNLPSFHWLLISSLHFGPSSNSHYDNSGVKQFTWHKPNGLSRSRVDYWVVSGAILDYVNEAKIPNCPLSDHCTINLKLKKQKSSKPKDYWKINSKVLLNLEFRQSIKEIILEIKK
ncbi:hypothetical protein AMECASPLE_038754 [Ameca splendens]|uniref:Uncharacterized protein n=1 Tax=Ameca splendens TaxID=208324 RepID=A0ABV0XX94_9TELE